MAVGTRGLLGLELRPGASVEAPMSGVRFGSGQNGPVTVRLSRVVGTRIAVAARVLPAQLLAVRAGAAGLPVQVVTSRAQLWDPLLRQIPACRVVPEAAAVASVNGPCVVIDDRPIEGRSPLEIKPWQCRVDIRSQWSPTDLSTLARYDLVVFGAVAPEATKAIAATFGLPRGGAEPLTRLDASSFALLRRAAADFVSLDPTVAEAQLLDTAKGFGSVSPRVRG